MSDVLRIGALAVIVLGVCAVVAIVCGASTHHVAIGVEIVGLAISGSATLFGIAAARHEPFGIVVALVMGGLTTFLAATGPISL